MVWVTCLPKGVEVMPRFRTIKINLYQSFILMIFLLLTGTSIIVFLAIYYSAKTPIFEKVTYGLPFALSLVLFLSITIGTSLAFFLRKRILAPLKSISLAAQEIANGNYNIKLSNKSQVKELSQTYQNFNIMAEALQKTELLQKDFISKISHELKTPISILDGYSSLLTKQPDDPQKVVFYAQRMKQTATNFNHLTENILLLSRLENQPILMNQKYYRLDEQIRKSILSLEPLIEKKRISIEVDLPIMTVNKNENLFFHVWNNILTNAINHSPEHGIVKIIGQTNGTIHFINNGELISSSKQKKFFQQFYKGNNSEGHGLGLTIVKQILSASNCEIHVESKEGLGTDFIIKFSLNEISY